MNLEQCIVHANKRATKTGRVYYVVYEPDDYSDYHVATEEDLDMFFCGRGDPVYCTADNGNGL